MTPDKNKKPLPTSTSFVLPDQPITYQQWRIALHHIKALYFRGQWKHCVARCTKLIVEANSALLMLHASYIHFYCALSNEAIARSAHALSNSKVKLLEQARSSYETAASLLPPVERTLKSPDLYDSDSCSEHSSGSTESEILDYYGSSPRSSSSSDNASSSSSIASSRTVILLKPSPLQVRKVKVEHLQDDIESPPAVAQASAPPQTTNYSTNYMLSPKTMSNWLYISSLERYNADLTAYADMLASHVTSIETLIRTTREVHAMRTFADSSVRCDGDETVNVASLKCRIAQLKSEGWRRERFRPEKYQKLCELALDEL